MQSGARSMWCESVRLYVGFVSKHQRGCFPVRAKRRTLVEMQAEPQILDQSIKAQKEGNCPKVPLGRVAYVFPSNEAGVIRLIKCNVQMSFKV